MFDLIRLAFNIGIPEPKVGTILVDKIWDNYTKIEIVRVSENKKEVLYKFLTAGGEKGSSGTYTATWKYLCTDIYKILGD